MALVPYRRSETEALADLRSMITQNETDIQRLWKLAHRARLTNAIVWPNIEPSSSSSSSSSTSSTSSTSSDSEETFSYSCQSCGMNGTLTVSISGFINPPVGQQLAHLNGTWQLHLTTTNVWNQNSGEFPSPDTAKNLRFNCTNPGGLSALRLREMLGGTQVFDLGAGTLSCSPGLMISYSGTHGGSPWTATITN